MLYNRSTSRRSDLFLTFLLVGMFHLFFIGTVEAQFTVNSTSPAASAIDVNRSDDILIYFSADVDGATASSNIQIRGEHTGEISGSFLAGGTELAFTPDNNFKSGERIEVVVTTDVTSTGGDPLDAPYSFFFEAAVDPGTKTPPAFDEEVVSTNADDARSVQAADVDGDGDLDLLSASNSDNKIAWYENDGSQNFTEHEVSTSADGATSVQAADVDGDGDIDILSASQSDDKIAWYENDGSQDFTEHEVSTNADGAWDVYAADVDGDGNMDILSASFRDDKIAWYENDGSQNFTEHIVSTSGAFTLFATDVDGDGDMDILSASGSDDTLAWYENDGSQNFTEHIVSTNVNSARSVYASDVDGDGDLDLLTAAAFDDKIAWYENDGSQNFTEQEVSTSADGAESVFASDVDGDGDMDILSASKNDDKIAWYENDGSQNFTERVVSTNADDARNVQTADMDGDGDLDLLATAANDDKIAWYDNDINYLNLVDNTPFASAGDVDVSSDITLSFDQDVDGSTVSSNIQVRGEYTGNVSGSFSTSGTEVTFTPDSDFKPGERIEVTMTTDIASTDDNPAERPQNFFFNAAVEPGPEMPPAFKEEVVSTNADAPRSVQAADVDGDGDLDLLSASSFDDKIAWYENNGSGTFTEREVTTNAEGAMSVGAADVDGDGDLDLLSASQTDDKIAWYENNGSEGFTEREVTTNADGARSVRAADVDGDGDLDLLSASFGDSKIAWYENDGSEGFTERVVSTNASGATSVHAADVDGDGNLDLLSASFVDDKISWYENDGSQGFTEHAVSTNADGAQSVQAADVDGDGNLDLLSASRDDNKISWYENDGSETFTEHEVSTNADGAQSVQAADVDGDGDLDLLSASNNDDKIAWYENDGSEGFTERVVSTNAAAAQSVQVADVDGDGDLDLLSASQLDDKVAWYENLDALDMVSNTPAAGANDIPVSSDVTLGFDQDVDAATVSSSTIRVRGVQTGEMSGSLSVDGSNVTFTPDNDYRGGERIWVTVTEQVASTDGNPPVSPQNFFFETAVGPAPEIPPAFSESAISDSADGASSVQMADINGDGDLDLLSASSADDKIAWYENDGSETFTEHEVSTSASGASSVLAADVDGDGDMDILSASEFGNNIVWYENDGSEGFTERVVSTNANGAKSVQAADVDGDGDLDLLSASSTSRFDGKVAWYENDGLENFTEHRAGGILDNVQSVYATDLDGDGDMDLLASERVTFSVQRIVWLENDGAQNFNQRSIGTNGRDITSVYAADVDRDGDMDILSASAGNHRIAWYENNGSETFTERVVSTTTFGARSVRAADVDGDGDLDLLSASNNDDKIAWYENDGSEGFTEREVSTNADGAQSVHAADVNGDGDLDLLSASRNDDKIALYSNIDQLELLTSTPADGVFDVNRSSEITIGFDQEIDGSTVSSSTIKVTGEQTGELSGSFTASGKEAIFTPDDDYRAGERIRVRVSTSVSSNDGSTLDEPYSFSFEAAVAAAPESPPSFSGSSVSTNADGARSVHAADIDGDGNIDLLSASENDDKIAWYANDGSENFSEQVVSTDADAASSVYAADLDSDGDMDLLSASENDKKIAWYENDGSQNFTEQVISTSASAARSVYATDMDKDGDIDLLSASGVDNKIAWYENDGSQDFTEHEVSSSASGAYSVFAADVDGDGNVDILSASANDDKIAWYENDGSQTFTERTVSTSADEARSVYATDIDGDGDLDLLSASRADDKIAWYENDGSETFTEHEVSSDANGALDIRATDVDGDGDMDILSASEFDDKIAWYANDGSQNFTEQVVSTNADGAESVYAADLDGDGDMDLMSASSNDSELDLYENISSSSPTLVNNEPADGASGVALDAAVSAGYDQNIQAADLSGVTIQDDSGTDVSNISVNIIEQTLTIDHDDLQNGTLYTATVPAGAVENTDGMTNSTDQSWSFTTSLTTPNISSQLPSDAATSVSTDADVMVTFNQDVSKADLSGIGIEDSEGNPVAGVSGSLSGNTLEISHGDFANGTTYTVTVPAGAVKNDEGITSEALSWSFTTVLPAPDVSTLSPSHGATGLALDADISVTFDQDVSKADLTGIGIEDSEGNPVAGVSGSLSGNSLEINHNDFVQGETYTVSITTGTVENEDGVSNETLSWSFTTNLSVPDVSSLSPPHGATGVALDAGISVTFDFDISESNLDGITIEDSVGNSVVGVNGTLSGNTIDITHNDFAHGDTYTVNIPAETVKNEDGVGNEAFNWSFTSVLAAPAIVSKSPADGGTGVALDSSVTVAFDQDISEADLLNSITIENSEGNPVEGVDATLSDSTVEISHNAFSQGETFLVSIPSGAVENEDGVGNEAVNWSFTSVLAAPAIVSKSPADGVTGVALDAGVTVAFDQDVSEADLSGIEIIDSQGTVVEEINSTLSGNTINIAHADFEHAETYTVNVPAGTVENDSGVENEAVNWSFTSVLAAPAIVSKSPADGGTDVALDSSVTVTFDQDVNEADFSGISIKDAAGNPVSVSGSLSGNTLSITHDDFVQGGAYTVSIPANAIENSDGVGNEVTSWSFVTEIASEVTADANISFSDAASPQDYRLVAIPGTVEEPLQNVLEGNHKTDWQAWWDNGSTQDYLVKFDSSDTFTLAPGNGFWVTASETFSYSETVSNVELNSQGQVSIPLHHGWNIISNPLDIDVDWSAVEEVNEADLQPIWGFDGFFIQASQFTSAKGGQAYYFLNDQGLDELLIPYMTTSEKEKSISGKQEIQLSTQVNGQQTSASNIVFAPKDRADAVAPSSGFERASLRFNIETDNQKYRRADEFARILREFDVSGQDYPMVLSAEPDKRVSITAELLNLSNALQVVLIDQQTGIRHDLAGADSVAFTPEAEQTKLTLAVGDADYVDQLQQKYLPKQVEMMPNYPNPFNPSTTLKFSLPERAEVNLVVYDVLGRRVATLIDEVREAGVHSARFDASRYASGMYFGVIEIGDQRFVEKMLLIK